MKLKYDQIVTVQTREGPRQARYTGNSSNNCVHLRLLDLLGNETGRQVTVDRKWLKESGEGNA